MSADCPCCRGESQIHVRFTVRGQGKAWTLLCDDCLGHHDRMTACSHQLERERSLPGTELPALPNACAWPSYVLAGSASAFAGVAGGAAALSATDGS